MLVLLMNEAAFSRSTHRLRTFFVVKLNINLTLVLMERSNNVSSEGIRCIARSDSPHDWKTFTAPRREIKHLIRMAELQCFIDEINFNKGNSGSIWKVIHKALSKKPTQQLQYRKRCFWRRNSMPSLYLLGKKQPLPPSN